MNSLALPRKLADLHTAEEALAAAAYTEVSFSCNFYELFPDANVSGANGIMHVLRSLGITAFDQFIIQKFKDRNNHDVQVFHSSADKRVFAYFDLQKEAPADEMFFFGLSYDPNDDAVVFPKIMTLYKQLKNCSPLSYDSTNSILYNKVFRSNFYFYKNNYSPYGRQMQHHGLKL